MRRLDFAGYAVGVEGLGPGIRAVIWVRGCPRRCPGCVAPELWHPGEPTPVEDVVRTVAPLLNGADGLTISGGEPFDQPAALADLLDMLRRDTDVEVLVYTGYLLEELRGQEEAKPLLERIDMLIDGPYREELPNTRQWRGSDNQRLHLLTPRALRYAADVDGPMPDARPLQVQMLGPQRFRIIGIPRRGDLEAYCTAMAARGLDVRLG